MSIYLNISYKLYPTACSPTFSVTQCLSLLGYGLLGKCLYQVFFYYCKRINVIKKNITGFKQGTQEVQGPGGVWISEIGFNKRQYRRHTLPYINSLFKECFTACGSCVWFHDVNCSLYPLVSFLSILCKPSHTHAHTHTLLHFFFSK